MKKLLEDVRVLIIFILVTAASITYIFTYIPLNKEYEKNIIKNFALTVRLSLDNAKEADLTQLAEGVRCSKIDKNCVNRILTSYRKYEWVEEIDLIDEGQYISCISPIPDSSDYWYIKVKKASLLKPAYRMFNTSLARFLIVIFFSIIFANYTVIRKIRKLIANLEMSKERYKEYAVRDAVTGVYSRAFFENWILDRSSEIINGINSLSAIIMIDLDGFKEVNDTYGHLVGDEVLCEIANILKKSIREGDFVIRYGGDEFLILLRKCNVEYCEQIISRIEEKLEELNQYNKYNIRISYGIEEIRDRSRLLEHIKNADEKMYRMKKKKQDE